MEQDIMSAADVGLNVTNLIGPFVMALLALVVTLWFKDFATKIAKGLAFNMDKTWSEGDSVLLDGRDAIIVKIGLTTTVFGTYGERGYTWRYVPNERITSLKLEKIINPDLHMDSELEKAQKMQKMVDLLQDNKINNNSNAIKENQEKLAELSKK